MEETVVWLLETDIGDLTVTRVHLLGEHIALRLRLLVWEVKQVWALVQILLRYIEAEHVIIGGDVCLLVRMLLLSEL